jgi:serine/threonine protein kinase
VQAPSIRPGDVLDGKYLVQDIIGEGGMGVVASARHIALDTAVAIKVLRVEGADGCSQRLLREARASCQIDSEHVARVFDAGQLDDETPYIVMELLDGRDLDEIVHSEGPLDVATAVRYVLQICEALAAVHGKGIVHRDVKPANLFLTHRNDGSPCIKLLDFGISKVSAASMQETGPLTRTHEFLGSPPFMSPEQLTSCSTVDGRSDLWSLGVTLFELLTAESAFDGPSTPELCGAILRDEPRRLREFRPNAPAGLESAILRCLVKAPAERVQSAEELALLLQPFAPDDVAHDDGESLSGNADTPMRTVPEVLVLEHENLDDDLLAGSDEVQAEPLAAPDRTPSASVCPVSLAAMAPVERRARGWTATSSAAALVAAGLFGGASALLLSGASAHPMPVHRAPQNAAAVATVGAVAAPLPTSNAGSVPFHFSTQVDEPERERLEQELAIAADELEQGKPIEASVRVQGIQHDLRKLDVAPHTTSWSSMLGAKSQLLVGRLESAKLTAVLRDRPADMSEAVAWSKRVDSQLGQTGVAYDRVVQWGVRSFFRCGLVEVAALDRAAGEAFTSAATSSTGRQRAWLATQAHLHFRRAGIAIEHALLVRSETLLCVEDARRERDRVAASLATLEGG